MENGFYTDLNATIGDGEQVDGTGGVSDWRNQARDNLRLTVAPESEGVWQDTEFRAGIENIFDAQYTPNLALRPEPGRSFTFTHARTF